MKHINLKYDFHIHSCLSPCAENEMTPQNIVGMAKLMGLDIIALTDHNSTGNCRAVMEAGEEAGLTVIPGMELCTAEEIHIVCLMPDIEAAERFGAMIRELLPPVKNRPDVFGEQIILDKDDNPLGNEELLLSTASSVVLDDVEKLCREYGGFAYPAHIDRPAYSVLSSMGMLVPEWGFTCAEITPNADIDALKSLHKPLRGMRTMRSSDSHWLENMAGFEPDVISPAENTAKAVVEWLRGL